MQQRQSQKLIEQLGNMSRTSTSLADMIRRDVLNVVPLNDDIETTLSRPSKLQNIPIPL